MMDCYLLDANAIREIPYDVLQNRCSYICTIDDVIDEVGLDKDKAKLLIRKNRVFTLNEKGYEAMRSTLQLDDVRKLVDYFYNHGTGDVAILAFASQISCNQEGRLVRENVIIVTNDKGVWKACSKLHIKYLSTAQFEGIGL